MEDTIHNLKKKSKVGIELRELTDKELQLQAEWLSKNEPKRKDIDFDITSLYAINHKCANSNAVRISVYGD